MAENGDNPATDEIDVGEPVDRLAAQIAKGEAVGWGGPEWRRARRRSMRFVAWIGLCLLAVCAIAILVSWMILWRG